MAYQTIVAVFDTAAHAAAAVEALKAGGFAAADISVFDRDRLTGGRGDANAREPGLWHRLFGGNMYQHEAKVYGQAVEEGRRRRLSAGAGQRSRPRDGHPGAAPPGRRA